MGSSVPKYERSYRPTRGEYAVSSGGRSRSRAAMKCRSTGCLLRVLRHSARAAEIRVLTFNWEDRESLESLPHPRQTFKMDFGEERKVELGESRNCGFQQAVL
nr:hypothetical protein Iba_chr14cCG2820 [Ipomoea batatas]